MKIYAIADLHLSFDERIDKPMDVFGPGWDNHAERVKNAWFELVEEDDIVIVPGDISWGLKLEEAMADLEWISTLPGKKVLLKGNHDLWWCKINYLKTLYENMFFLQNDCFYIEESQLAVCGARGWPTPDAISYTEHDKKMYLREQGRLRNSLEQAKKLGAKNIICAMHYPPAKTEESEFMKIMAEYNVTICIYGHLHGMISFMNGIKGRHNGIEYNLVSLDYLGAIPKLIYDNETE